MIVTKKWSDTPIKETPHKVDVRNMYNTEEAMISIISLQPGESLVTHITPVDVAFYVIEGKGEVLIGDEAMEVDAMTLIESPKDIKHGWSNKSDSLLRFMVVKAPRPTKESKFLG
jgi:quercetin dioxygenase-like cupin family protein